MTCGAPAGTPFCARCGERRAADRPRTLRALVDELWDAFSPADGRIGRTLWTLVRRPGELTAAYMRGERQPYVPPLRLFLLVNVLFFLHASFAGNRTFDTPLAVHLNRTMHEAIARRFVLRRMPPSRGETSEAYNKRLAAGFERDFDRNSTTQAKSLVIAMVPMFTVLVTAVSWRRRRHLLQDVVFGVHAMAVMLLVIITVPYLLVFPLRAVLALLPARPSDEVLDVLVSMPMVAVFGTWLRFGLRRAYGDGRWVATLKAATLALGFGVVLFAYRALLFFTTFYATRAP